MSCPIESSIKKIKQLTAMSIIVIYGKVLVGFSSFNGKNICSPLQKQAGTGFTLP
jgi:hypothetical protein